MIRVIRVDDQPGLDFRIGKQGDVRIKVRTALSKRTGRRYGHRVARDEVLGWRQLTTPISTGSASPPPVPPGPAGSSEPQPTTNSAVSTTAQAEQDEERITTSRFDPPNRGSSHMKPSGAARLSASIRNSSPVTLRGSRATRIEARAMPACGHGFAGVSSRSTRKLCVWERGRASGAFA